MCREGQVDKLSGQRAAFPVTDLDDDPTAHRVREYLDAVSHEARAVLWESMSLTKKRRRDSETGRQRSYVEKRPPPVDLGALSYSEPMFSMAQLQCATADLLHTDFGRARMDFRTLYEASNTFLTAVPAENQAASMSRSAWVEFMRTHKPTQVTRAQRFRLLGYLYTELAAGSANCLFEWAWFLLLGTALPVSGTEMSTIRDVGTKCLHATNLMAWGYANVCSVCFGQLDLV